MIPLVGVTGRVPARKTTRDSLDESAGSVDRPVHVRLRSEMDGRRGLEFDNCRADQIYAARYQNVHETIISVVIKRAAPETPRTQWATNRQASGQRLNYCGAAPVARDSNIFYHLTRATPWRYHHFILSMTSLRAPAIILRRFGLAARGFPARDLRGLTGRIDSSEQPYRGHGNCDNPLGRESIR